MANKVGFNALPHGTVHWTLLLSETAFMCFLRGKQSSRRNDVGRVGRTVGTRHAESETKTAEKQKFCFEIIDFLGFLHCMFLNIVHYCSATGRDSPSGLLLVRQMLLCDNY